MDETGNDIIDEAGNLSVANGELSRIWDLPESDPEVRLPLVRQYRSAPITKQIFTEG